MKHLLKLSLFLLPLFSCDKKVKLKIKNQAREYVVVFGIVTNQATTHSITVGLSENYEAGPGGTNLDAIVKMEYPFGTYAFTNAGNGVYTSQQSLMPNMPYRFSCTYQSKLYSYEVITGGEMPIKSLSLNRQNDERYTLTARIEDFSPVNFILMQLYVGDINANADTVWQTYNERFTNVNPKLKFLAPFVVFADSTGHSVIDVIKNAPLKPNDLVKLEVYNIDHVTGGYLNRLTTPDNYLYDPLSLAPPLNYFAFSNEALGVVVPAMVTKKIIKVP